MQSNSNLGLMIESKVFLVGTDLTFINSCATCSPEKFKSLKSGQQN